jgi:hypothetical protein
MDSEALRAFVLPIVPGAEDVLYAGLGPVFWLVDAAVSGPARQAYVLGRAATAYQCELLAGTPSALVTISVWSGPPQRVPQGSGPFYCPSGAIEVEASHTRVDGPIQLDGPGLYWVWTTNPVQASGGDIFSYQPRDHDPYDVKIWRIPGQTPVGTPLFQDVQPWDVAEGVVDVSHREFWIHAGDVPELGEPPLIPDGDRPRARGGVVAVPAMLQMTRAGVVLSVWEDEPPAAAGHLLGECRIDVGDERELHTAGVNGPGDAVLVLPDAGAYGMVVWRRIEPGEAFEYERYDVRVWGPLGP